MEERQVLASNTPAQTFRPDLVDETLPSPKGETPASLSGEEGRGTKSSTENHEAQPQEFAVQFLRKVVRLRGVHIDRDKFLRAELHRRGHSATVISSVVSDTPGGQGLSPDLLDEIARSAIEFESRKSSAISFAAGLPGGLAMIGTVPADITQFYVHAFRVMQKLAYIYGWTDLLNDSDEVDDETLGKLVAFLGVMMGVGGASNSVSYFASSIARPAIQKKIASTTLSKTVWYTPMKQTLRVVGVQVTKQNFAKSVSKVVPVVGGVVSGGLTFVALRQQSYRLMKHLRELPPPNVDAAQYLDSVKRASEDQAKKVPSLHEILDETGTTIKQVSSNAMGKMRWVRKPGS